MAVHAHREGMGRRKYFRSKEGCQQQNKLQCPEKGGVLDREKSGRIESCKAQNYAVI